MKLVQNPCVKDCLWRNPWCHGFCPRYLEYNKYREFVRESRAKEHRVNYDMHMIKKSGIKNSHKHRDKTKEVQRCKRV